MTPLDWTRYDAVCALLRNPPPRSSGNSGVAAQVAAATAAATKREVDAALALEAAAAAAKAAADAEVASQAAAALAGLTAAAMADGGSPVELSAAYVCACTANFAPERALGTPGAFGAVFRGEDAALRVSFAVKRLSHTAPWPAERSAAREIAILSRFRHPHIIRLWGFTTEPAERCLVYELGDGGALSDNLTDDARAASARTHTRALRKRRVASRPRALRCPR